MNESRPIKKAQQRSRTRRWLVVGMLGGLAVLAGLPAAWGAYLQERGDRTDAPREGAGFPGGQEGPGGFGPPGGGFPGGGFPGGPGGPGGFGGPGGPGGGDRELVKEFDANEDGWLNAEERSAAKEKLSQQGGRRGMGGPGGGRGGRGGRGFPGGAAAEATAGKKLSPKDVASYPDQDLYDDAILRTIFIQFEDVEDWNEELATFKSSDVEVPATITVDQKVYPLVGVKHRGNSSYGMVPTGFKKSLNLSFDMADKDQDLYGFRTLNLLNCNGDPSLLSSALYSHVAGPYMAVPKSNMIRVVINGESWGLFANVEQFNKDYVETNYGQSKGARWKVPGRPGGDGGLRYVGDSVEAYRSRYEIKSKDREEDWAALMELCRVIDQTPVEELRQELTPLMDIPQLLWFLAVDNASVNSDGYWTRASDYNIYRDPEGVFHISPYDMNEAFMTAQHGPPGGGFGRPGGPGGFGGPGGPGGFGPPEGGPGVFGPGGILPGMFGPGPGGPEGRPGAPGEEDGIGRRGSLDDAEFVQARGRQERDDQQRGGRGRDRQRDQQREGRGGRQRGGRGFGGPGGGPMGHGSFDLDPLVGMDDTNKPLRSKILAVPEWRTQYLSYMKRLAEHEFAPERIEAFINSYRQLLMDDVEAETRRTSPTEAFVTATNPDADVEGSLASFFAKRRNYLLSHPEIKNLDASDVPLRKASASKVKSDTQATTRLRDETPLSAAPKTGKVLINEILAEARGSSDWIELYNPGLDEVALDGYWLSDSLDQLEKWPIPEGTVIGPRQFLVIWADDEAEPGLHANFKLSRKGENVSLVHKVDSRLEIVDRVEFPQQTKDIAFGRFPSGDGSWQPLSPTPGHSNRDSEN